MNMHRHIGEADYKCGALPVDRECSGNLTSEPPRLRFIMCQ